MTKRLDHRLPIYPTPPTRGHCIAGESPGEKKVTGSFTERVMGQFQCKAMGCRKNLLAKMPEDMAGRPHDGFSPEWTIDGGHISASAPSCVLDVIAMHGEGKEMSAGEVAKKMNNVSRRRIEQHSKEFKKTTKALALARLGESD